MKKNLLAGLFMALVTGSFAQSLKVTMFISPFPDCSVELIGKTMPLIAYNNTFEITKNRFILDFRESVKDNSIPPDALHVIFLIDQDGRRRIKAETQPSFTNIEKEILDFSKHPLPYHYSLYDIQNGFEYHIYLKRPEQLDSLYSVNFIDALNKAFTPMEKELNRSYSVHVQGIDTTWTVSGLQKHSKMSLELGTFTGLGLINNHITPLLGIGGYLKSLDNFGRARRRLGLLYEIRVLSDYSKYEFYNTSIIGSVNFQYDFNFSTDIKKEFWNGIHAGIFIAKEGSLKNAFRFGFETHLSSFAVNFDFFTTQLDDLGLGLSVFFNL
jgi:hypothetical protein